MNTIPIDSTNAFECVACDILEDFVGSFNESNGCITAVNADGYWFFTDKGEGLYERYIARLRAIGEKLFPGEGEDMDIKAWSVRDDF